MSNIISGLMYYIYSAFDIINYLFADLKILLAILGSPFLFIMVVFTLAHFYVAITASTRRQCISKYFEFFSSVGSMCYNTIKLLLPVISSIIQSISTILQGVLSAPPIVVLGNGIPPGSIIAVAIVILIVAYGIFTF